MRIILLIQILFLVSCSANNSDVTRSKTKDRSILLWLNDSLPDEVVKRAVDFTLLNSEIICAQVGWHPTEDNILFEEIDWYSHLAREHDKQLHISIDWQNQNRDSVKNGFWLFSDPITRNKFCEDVKKIVEMYKPEILNLGVECNFYALTNPEDYKSFIDIFNQCKGQIKKTNPKCEVGLSFQWEVMTGVSSEWLGEKSFGELNCVIENLDFIGISTYPNLRMDSCLLCSLHEIKQFSDTSSIDIMISETSLPNSRYNDSERVRYLKSVKELMRHDKMKGLIWSSTLDINNETTWFGELGLLDSLGFSTSLSDEWMIN